MLPRFVEVATSWFIPLRNGNAADMNVFSMRQKMAKLLESMQVTHCWNAQTMSGMLVEA